MRKVLATLLCSLFTVLPLSTLAAGEGAILSSNAAARRAARLKGEAPPEIPKQTTTTTPGSVTSRAEARRLARLRTAPRVETGSTTLSSSEARKLILDLTNAERAKVNLPALTMNSQLELSAQKHALDMQQRKFFAHINPDSEGPAERIKKTGYLDITEKGCNCSSWRYAVGENIAKGQSTPQEAVRDWMASPPHKEAILSPEYTEIGIGIVGEIWVQNFGSIKITPR